MRRPRIWIDRPDPAPVTPYRAPAPECELCTWVPVHDGFGGTWWKLKYANRICGLHGHLLEALP